MSEQKQNMKVQFSISKQVIQQQIVNIREISDSVPN